MNIHEAFFCILRLGLGMEDEFPYMLTQEEWQELMDMGYRQSLFGVMMDGIAQLNPEQKPPRELLLRGMQLLMKIEMTNRKLNRKVCETAEYFEKEGFHSCLLKGQGLAALYPNPLHRMSGDIDIWLTDGRKKITAFLKSKFEHLNIRYHHVDCPLWNDVEVEVHTTPSWMNNPFVNRKLQTFFSVWKSNVVCVELPDEGKIKVPSDEMNRIYVLVHIYRHLFQEGIGLRQLADYCMLLKKGITEEEKCHTVSLLEKLHMTRFAMAVMLVMGEVFGLEKEKMLLNPSEKYGRRLLEEVMIAGNFGQYDNRINRKMLTSAFGRFLISIKRNMRFMLDYPYETLWAVPFKLWHYVWRKILFCFSYDK